MRFVRQRVKHIIWELAESGVVGIPPPIIPVIGKLYFLIISIEGDVKGKLQIVQVRIFAQEDGSNHP